MTASFKFSLAQQRNKVYRVAGSSVKGFARPVFGGFAVQAAAA
jgi:hypothetical protein